MDLDVIFFCRPRQKRTGDGIITESDECIQTQMRKENSAQLQTKSSIYPNPTSGEIVVHLEEKGILNIYNQNGILVRNFSLEKGHQTLKLDLPSGVYMITDNNSIQEKLVIID